jgi:hypothetical protein
MDSPAAQWLLAAVRGVLLLGLLWAGVRLGRLGDRLSLAAGFGLACVAMLMVSPVARGHYFMLSVPAILFFTPWLAARGLRRTAVALALVPAALSVLHYVLLPWTGRIGLLGLGTACWLVAALVLTIRNAGRPVAPAASSGEPLRAPHFLGQSRKVVSPP